MVDKQRKWSGPPRTNMAPIMFDKPENSVLINLMYFFVPLVFIGAEHMGAC